MNQCSAIPSMQPTPSARAIPQGRTRRAGQFVGMGLLLGALCGCQSITGSQQSSQVRVIDASPDAGGLDVYQGSGILAYNLGLGTVTSYVAITPGTYSIVADTAGTRQQRAAQSGSFTLGAQYTVLISNYPSSLQETVLKDQSQPAPSGQVSLRLLDQAARTGNVDLYLIPSGSTILTTKPILTSVAFGNNTGYFNVPAGAYTLAALPAGTVPTATGTTLYTGAAVTYTAGAARTVVLLDQSSSTTAGLQVVTASDYDSISASQ